MIKRKTKKRLIYRHGKYLFFALFFFVFLTALPYASFAFKADAKKNSPIEKIFGRESKIYFYLRGGAKIANFPRNSEKSEIKEESIAEEDTSKSDNRILSLTPRGGKHELKVKIKETDKKIKIEVYNILAKKVLDVFEGYPHGDPEIPYIIDSSSLSDGVYICVVRGYNFRLLQKFIVSR